MIDLTARGLRFPPKPRRFGSEMFHAAHRGNLPRKSPEWYGRFGWSEPADSPYVWPSPGPAGEGVMELKWFKMKQVEGGIVARYDRHGKQAEVSVRPAGNGGDKWAFWAGTVQKDNPMGTFDTKDAAKKAALDYAALMSRPSPPVEQLYARKKKETVTDWLRRMAAENGLHPRTVLDIPVATKVAKIQVADRPLEGELKALSKECYKLAVKWAEDHNARFKRGEEYHVVAVTPESWGRVEGEGGKESPAPAPAKETTARPPAAVTAAPSSKTTPKGSSARDPKPGKKDPKPPKGGPDRDEWGTKVGTSAHKVNEVFRASGGAPLASNDVWKKAGCVPRSGHLTWLKNRDRIVRLPDGTWKLVGESKPAGKKSKK